MEPIQKLKELAVRKNEVLKAIDKARTILVINNLNNIPSNEFMSKILTEKKKELALIEAEEKVVNFHLENETL